LLVRAAGGLYRAVLTATGIAIGLNAAFLNIATEWLSDIKLGYCTTAFYLNENFCCSGAESGMPQASGFAYR
jgi:chloride channel 3/4/5